MLVLAQPTSKVESVYNALLNDIVNYKIKPGTRLEPKELAEQYSAHEAEVREVLQRLLITKAVMPSSDKQCSIVVLPPPEWLENMMLAVAGVESMIIESSVPFLSNEEIGNIIAIDIELQEVGKKGVPHEYTALNLQFHAAICAKSPCFDLFHMLEDVRDRSVYRRILFAVKPGAVNTSHIEHEQLIRFVKKRDARKVAELTRDHYVRIAREVADVVRNTAVYLTCLSMTDYLKNKRQ